jgi:signal peptidase I
MKLSKKKIGLIIVVIVGLGLVLLPLIAQTGSYPLAIIDGSSMYPTFQNGDVVYYHSVPNKANLPNGTIIVFVQSNTGGSFMEGLVRPVVIHRIIGQIVQNDGIVNYETQGDNNDQKDPFLTKSDNVLGVSGIDIPKIGFIVLFLKSPQGLIATIGIISLAYISMYDMKRKTDKNKEKLLGALAKKVLNGYLSDEQFKKLELAIKYSDEMESASLKDRSVFALVDWLKNGGIEAKWNMRMVACPTCFHIAVGLESGKDSVTICSNCNEIKTWNTTLVLSESSLNSILMGSIDEAFSALGEEVQITLYRELEHQFAIKKKQIPKKLDNFSVALEKIFGANAEKLDLLLVKTFKKNLLLVCRVDSGNNNFQKFVKLIQNNIDHMDNQTLNENALPKTIVDTTFHIDNEPDEQKNSKQPDTSDKENSSFSEESFS